MPFEPSLCFLFAPANQLFEPHDVIERLKKFPSKQADMQSSIACKSIDQLQRAH